ncbi:Trp biosynthesis-associated membrane protein [Cellulomonas fimi]|uniref:Trp biosynthesis associated, transmembrane protein, Oprn/Chp n=1 Tax=Cellulomonas fimi (strain ATCC 484 / DSM 20113 / JCM 1341 / CCUG 24087 / LMG 16345 / NBRC 15513 / NCIMB 8980 / NCTC 7547 / NRS-133) TaxID=590998 RepID=F4GYE3_CELFA|nr:Trp biosynthesis-associated membrane protein [Cellulomonas fimi]AEE45932.1 Trp biosynthesis associated, transmembrane protein, Oprn/Chp [Cellulomonas fimi ATCC 484]VEH31041.1 Tryptophan-associated transmembrane protein (Trp_oprn_chp) [Cellulomonas fimi]
MTQDRPPQPAGGPGGPDRGATAPGRRGRGRAAAVLVLLAALTGAVAVPTWLTARGTTALRGTVELPVAGTQVAPGIVGAAVVLLAAAAAVALVGRAGRWLVAVVTAAAGVLVGASAVAVLADPRAAALPVVTTQTGVGRVVGAVEVTLWPWAATAVGVAVVLSAGWLVRTSRTWHAPSRRHEATPAAEGPVDERGAWDALSRGDDPT